MDWLLVRFNRNAQKKFAIQSDVNCNFDKNDFVVKLDEKLLYILYFKSK